MKFFSPCPHEYICPRQIVDQKRPCSYNIRFRNFPFNWLTPGQNERIFNGQYSYVVAQKGISREDSSSDWPRIVEEPICHKKSLICRVCTNRGKLEEIMLTKAKHGKVTFKYAKGKHMGQQIKMNLDDKVQEEFTSDSQLDDTDHI